jgi:hypothetical protein
MEKLVYIVWKREGDSDEDFKRRLLDETAVSLRKVPVERIRVSVTDDAVASGTPIGTMNPPKSGMVSFWMEQSQDCAVAEAVLAPACGRIEGYLVVESRPILNTEHVTPRGERTPGFSQVTCVLKRAELSHEEYLRVWYGEHRACASETQSTFGYVRNEIVRPLTPSAPVWTAIVEENFPIGALTDPAVFYDAVGDTEKLKANQTRMMETCQKFLDLSAIEAHHCSEYDL